MIYYLYRLNIGDGFIFSNEDELTTFLEAKIDVYILFINETSK